MEHEGDNYSNYTNFSERPSANADIKKNSQGVNNNNYNNSSSGVLYFSDKPQNEIKINRNIRLISKPSQRTGKLWNMKMSVIAMIVGDLKRIPKNLEKRVGELEFGRRTVHPMALFKFTEKCSEILRTLAVTWTSGH